MVCGGVSGRGGRSVLPRQPADLLGQLGQLVHAGALIGSQRGAVGAAGGPFHPHADVAVQVVFGAAGVCGCGLNGGGQAKEVLQQRGAAAPAIKVKDTVRQARGGRVLRTLERDELFLMQTPQVFRAGLIRPALEDAARLGLELTDDCAAVMLMDAEVFLVEGSEENMKLTTPADVYAAEAILEAREKR